MKMKTIDKKSYILSMQNLTINNILYNFSELNVLVCKPSKCRTVLAATEN